LFTGEGPARHRLLGMTIRVAGVLTIIERWTLDWKRDNAWIGTGALQLGAFTWVTAIFHARHSVRYLTPLQLLP